MRPPKSATAELLILPKLSNFLGFVFPFLQVWRLHFPPPGVPYFEVTIQSDK